MQAPRSNRRSPAQFSCKTCGYTTHADVNAALDMRVRALVVAPEVAGRCPQSSIHGKAFGNVSAAVRPSQDNWAYAAQ